MTVHKYITRLKMEISLDRMSPEKLVVLVYFLGSVCLVLDIGYASSRQLITSFDLYGKIGLMALLIGGSLAISKAPSCLSGVTAGVYFLFSLYGQSSWAFNLNQPVGPMSDYALMSMAIYLPVIYLGSHLVLQINSKMVAWINYTTTACISLYFLANFGLADRTKFIVVVTLVTHPLYLIFLTMAEFFAKADAELTLQNQGLRSKLTEDSLTTAGNRLLFSDLNDKVLSSDKRYVVAMLDIDHFKKINDTFGHEKGDDALKFLVKTAKSMLGAHDHIIRWGGEEFVVLMDSSVDYFERLNRIRLALKETSPQCVPGGFSVSIGVTVQQDKESLKCALVSADQALYASKKAGRDRVTCHVQPRSRSSSVIEESAHEY